jgi:hypothetical protein
MTLPQGIQDHAQVLQMISPCGTVDENVVKKPIQISGYMASRSHSLMLEKWQGH